MTEQQAIDCARAYFLAQDGRYGCAETACLVLQQAYGLPAAQDAFAAMGLNGGVAWSGEVCGAILGAALAVGRLAGERIADGREAKVAAREAVACLLADFRAEFGATRCRDLIGLDISTPAGHAGFIAGQTWQTACMAQIEFVIRRLLPLQQDGSFARLSANAGEKTE